MPRSPRSDPAGAPARGSSSSSGRALVLTCEHASNAVPARYRALFEGDRAVLETHRGYDLGALAVARDLQRATGAPLFTGRITRLLADLNRSPDNRRTLFSSWSRALDEDQREALLARHYRPYRDAVVAAMDAIVAGGGRVLHLSVHSFTPELDGEVRNAEVGLMYDPSRRDELRLALDWRARLIAADPSLRVRRNYPYRGVDDGFVPWLRRRYPVNRYLGFEVETNQRFVAAGGPRWRAYRRTLVTSFVEAARALGARLP